MHMHLVSFISTREFLFRPKKFNNPKSFGKTAVEKDWILKRQRVSFITSVGHFVQNRTRPTYHGHELCTEQFCLD